jgi:hypothetical protein
MNSVMLFTRQRDGPSELDLTVGYGLGNEQRERKIDTKFLDGDLQEYLMEKKNGQHTIPKTYFGR